MSGPTSAGTPVPGPPGPRPGPPASADVPVPGPAGGTPALRPPVPGPAPSGDEVPVGVAQALARLDELGSRPVPEHVEVFDGVHRLLQDALATLDEA